MAQVTFTTIQENDTRTAARLNTPFSNFQTQSTNIQENNIRHEGVDRRNITQNVVTNLSSTKVSAEGTTTAFAYTGAAFTNLNLHPGANPARISTFTIGATQVARVRFSCDVRRYDDNTDVSFALFQSIAGVVTEITGTRRTLNLQITGSGSVNNGFGHAPFALSKLLTTAATYDWIEARVLPGVAAVNTYISAYTLQMVIFSH
jgi:hypothetical protein